MLKIYVKVQKVKNLHVQDTISAVYSFRSMCMSINIVTLAH